MSQAAAKGTRAAFTSDEDTLLMKYIATYNPTKQNRSGNVLYKRLVENVDNKWNWSRTHTWLSWQTRYRNNMEEFDRRILRYQKKKGMNTEKQTGKEPQSPPPDEEAARDRSKETRKGKKRAGSQEVSGHRKVKRARLEKDQPVTVSSRSPLIKTNGTHETPAIGPSDQVRSSPPYQGPSEAASDMPPPSPNPANTFNIPSLPSRSDTLPVLSSPVNSLVRTPPPISSQLPPSSQPLASSSQQVVTPKPPPVLKRVLKHKSVSPIFRSLSPTNDRPTPSKAKVLPKVVEGHFTTTLTDRLGRVRLGSRSEEKPMTTWPPVRGKKGKEKEVGRGPTASTSTAERKPEYQRSSAPLMGQESAMAQPAPGPSKLTTATRETAGGYDLPHMDLRTLSTSTYRMPRSRASSSASHLPLRHSLAVHSTPSAIPAHLSNYVITSGRTTPSIPLTSITPVDLPLSASVGFKTLLSGIAAAHGYSPDVVLEVYKRVKSLEETEKYVRGMRHASESWIEAALERREREARRTRRASKENRDSDSSDDEPPRSSCHRPSLQQTLLERRLPNGLRVRHEPESSSKDLQDQDNLEYDGENEPEPASDDAEQLDEANQHEFSLQEPPRAVHIKRESQPPPPLYAPHEDSALNGEEVLNGALSDVHRTRSVSPPWNADEGLTPLSGNEEVHKMLERRLGKRAMRKRVAQLLR
ncbi:hypothetical protein C8R48DRAFT_743080 [Suillus tomentosus]|nr:hypothetical protein C8R48DRAFT_743080 [Suillus tomentosus]